MTQPVLKRVKGYNIAINVAAWEEEAGPILCIHGITANCRCWDVLAHSLIPDYRVLAMVSGDRELLPLRN